MFPQEPLLEPTRKRKEKGEEKEKGEDKGKGKENESWRRKNVRD